MKRMNRLTRTIAGVCAAMALAWAAAGCDDPVSAPPPPTVSGVTVTAAGNAAGVVKGATLQFSAAVSGENNPAQTVTWSIVEIGKHADTSISTEGLLTVAAGETQTSLTVKATSTVDTGKSGTKTVSVTDPALQTLSGEVTISLPAGVTAAITGMLLTANYSGTEAVAYQWKQDGAVVGTGSTYTPTTAGSCTVTVSASSYNSKTSEAVVVSAPDPEARYNVTVADAVKTYVIVSPSQAKAGATITVTLTGTPADKPKLASWSWNGNALSTASNQATFTMPAGDVTVSAEFEALGANDFAIVKSVTGGGTIAVPTSGVKGAAITLTATAHTGWELSSWNWNGTTITLSASGNTGTFTVPAGSGVTSVTVTAVFSKVNYTITITQPASGGTLTARSTVYPTSAEITTAQVGDRVNIHGTPGAGNMLTGVTVNNGAVEVLRQSPSSSVPVSFFFWMPAGNVTVSGVFSAAVTLSGTITFSLPDGITASDAYIGVYADADADYQYAFDTSSLGSPITGEKTYFFTLPANATYYVIAVLSVGSGDLTKRLGPVAVGAGNVTKNWGTVAIGAVTLSGTVSGTINGNPPTQISVAAYKDAAFTQSIGSYQDVPSAWSMTFSPFDADTAVYFRVAFLYNSVWYYRAAGSRTVGAADISGIDLGSFAVTTKTISGTATNYPPIGTSNVNIRLVDRSCSTVEDLNSAVTHGFKSYSSGSFTGSWSFDVESAVSTGWFVVRVPVDGVTTYYISQSAVTLGAGTGIVLDVGAMRRLELE